MTDTVKTVAESATGANRHIVWCDAQNQKHFYGKCAMLSDAYNAGRLKPEGTVDDSCAMAMSRNQCTALPMRAEEVSKGHAVYFTPPRDETSPRKVDKNSLSYRRGFNKVSGTKVEDKPIPKRFSLPANYNGAKPGVIKTYSRVPESQALGRRDRIEPESEFEQMDYSKAVSDLAAEKTVTKETGVAVVTAQQHKPKPEGESMLDIARRLTEEKRSA